MHRSCTLWFLIFAWTGLTGGCIIGPSQIVWPSDPVSGELSAKLDQLRPPPPESDSLREIKLVELTAYRPCQFVRADDPYYPFLPEAVPEAKEENPSIGIRINGDDDNHNSVPDRYETSVDGEDDLIEVRLNLGDAYDADQHQCLLRLVDDNLRLWLDANKKQRIVFDENHEHMVQSPTSTTLWVEWVGQEHGLSTLEIVVYPLDGETDEEPLVVDRLVFRTFRGIVLCMGGLGPKPPKDPGGLYHIAQVLYRLGYDTYMFEYHERSTAVLELKNAIRYRGVNEVAAFGHSIGSYSVYDVVDVLNQWRAETKHDFKVSYTAYVDSNLLFALDHPPALSTYHVNFYQTRDWFKGGPVRQHEGSDLPCINIDVTDWDQGINHYSIDNHAVIHAAILFGRAELCDGLIERVGR